MCRSTFLELADIRNNTKQETAFIITLQFELQIIPYLAE